MILQAMGGRVAVDLRNFLSLLPPFSIRNRWMDLVSFLVKSGVLCTTFRRRSIFFGEMVVSFGKPEVKGTVWILQIEEMGSNSVFLVRSHQKTGVW